MLVERFSARIRTDGAEQVGGFFVGRTTLRIFAIHYRYTGIYTVLYVVMICVGWSHVVGMWWLCSGHVAVRCSQFFNVHSI
jgi:hypothetical protein